MSNMKGMVRALLDDGGNKVLSAYRLALEAMLAAPANDEMEAEAQMRRDAERYRAFRADCCASRGFSLELFDYMADSLITKR
jgi:hypothetical protein